MYVSHDNNKKNNRGVFCLYWCVDLNYLLVNNNSGFTEQTTCPLLLQLPFHYCTSDLPNLNHHISVYICVEFICDNADKIFYTGLSINQAVSLACSSGRPQILIRIGRNNFQLGQIRKTFIPALVY